MQSLIKITLRVLFPKENSKPVSSVNLIQQQSSRPKKVGTMSGWQKNQINPRPRIASEASNLPSFNYRLVLLSILILIGETNVFDRKQQRELFNLVLYGSLGIFGLLGVKTCKCLSWRLRKSQKYYYLESLQVSLTEITKKENLGLLLFSLIYFGGILQGRVRQGIIIIITQIVCYLCCAGKLFEELKQAQSFFIMFFTLQVVYINRVLSSLIPYATSTQQDVILGFISAYAAFAVSYKQIEQLKNLKYLPLKEVQKLINHLQLLKNNDCSGFQIEYFMVCHLQNCMQIQCFCRKYSSALEFTDRDRVKLCQQIIQHSILSYFCNYQCSTNQKYELIHFYTDFLIQAGMFPKASALLQQYAGRLNFTNGSRHFLLVEKLRRNCNKTEILSTAESKLKHMQRYDNLTEHLVRQIREILRGKMRFWAELSFKQTLLRNVEKVGADLICKIEQLHEYFLFRIQVTQKNLNLSRCTSIYVTYLMLTTNFTEYASHLHKSMKKLMQMQMISLTHQPRFFIALGVRRKYEREMYASYQLVIENLSADLCTVLTKPKSSLVNENLSQIMPSELAEAHELKFSRLITSNFYEISQESFHQVKQLPYAAEGNRIVSLETEIKVNYLLNCDRLVFNCLLKQKINNSANFIIGQDGRILHQDHSWGKNQGYDSGVSIMVSQLCTEYRSDRKATSKQIRFEDETGIKLVQCSLIMPEYFKQQLIVKVKINKSEADKQKIEPSNLDQMKQIQMEELSKQVNQNDSQTSTTNRRESLSDIFSILIQKNSLKFEPYMTAIIIILALASLSIFLGLYYFNGIWDASVPENSPPYTTVSLLRLQNLFNSGLSWYYDLVQASKNNSSYTALFKQIYNTTIASIRKSTFTNLYQRQQNLINNYIIASNNEFNMYIRQFLNEDIIFTSSASGSPTVSMTLQAATISYVVDSFNIMSGSMNDLILLQTYSGHVYEKFQDMVAKLDEQVNAILVQARRGNITVLALSTLGLLVLLLPYFRLISTTKRKRYNLFNILAMIDGRNIRDQIHNLSKFEKQVSLQYEDSANSGTKPIHTGKKSYHHSSLPHDSSLNHSAQDLGQLLVNLPDEQRSRPAELIIKGSSCDRWTIEWPNLFVLLFMLATVITCAYLIIEKERYFTIAENTYKLSLQQSSILESASSAIFNVKMYTDEYTMGNRITFMGQDLQVWLENWIIGFNYTLTRNLLEDVMSRKCNTSNVLCKKPYSTKVLTGIIKRAVENAYRLRKQLLHNPQSFTSHNKLFEARKGLVFAQAAAQGIREVRLKSNVDVFNNLQGQQQIHQMATHQISQFFWVVFGLYLLACVAYCMHIKRRYLRELSLLTLLNSTMLYNNKLVEGFLRNLAMSAR